MLDFSTEEVHSFSARDYVLPAMDWCPPCSHWVVSSGSASSVPVVRVPLGTLRQSWHPQRFLLTATFASPLVVPVSLLLRPFYWRLFWSLGLPAKAFTPWWRLLQNSIGYRSRLHRWNPERYDTPFCAFCSVQVESLFHFVVGCPVKFAFWTSVLDHLGLRAKFPSAVSIWSALVTLCYLDRSPVKSEYLVLFGSAFSTLWSYHWRCILDELPWSSSGVFSMFLEDHRLVISPYLDRNPVLLDPLTELLSM